MIGKIVWIKKRRFVNGESFDLPEKEWKILIRKPTGNSTELWEKFVIFPVEED